MGGPERLPRNEYARKPDPTGAPTPAERALRVDRTYPRWWHEPRWMARRPRAPDDPRLDPTPGTPASLAPITLVEALEESLHAESSEGATAESVLESRVVLAVLKASPLADVRAVDLTPALWSIHVAWRRDRPFRVTWVEGRPRLERLEGQASDETLRRDRSSIRAALRRLARRGDLDLVPVLAIESGETTDW